MRIGCQYWQHLLNNYVVKSQTPFLTFISFIGFTFTNRVYQKIQYDGHIIWGNIYLCVNARRSNFLLTSLTLEIVDGGVKQSHWMTLAFSRLCNLCCSATSDKSSYFPTLISRDLNKILFRKGLLWITKASYVQNISQAKLNWP